jgi:hypothetical protein
MVDPDTGLEVVYIDRKSGFHRPTLATHDLYKQWYA